MAGVVTAVADDDERLFLRAAVLQMTKSLAHRVVKGGSSARGDRCQRFLEILWIVGKCLAAHELNRNVVIKIYDKHFILRITQMGEDGYCNNNVGQLGAH